MPLWEVYAEAARDFDKRAQEVTSKAQKILSKYPHHFDDEILSAAVRSILKHNHIDAYQEVTELEWKRILNEKTLFNEILAYYFAMLDEQIFRQANWLKSNDVPTEKNDIELRQNFLSKLYAIRNKKFEGHTVEGAIQFKLNQIKELSEVLLKTDMENLKDHHSLNIIEVISSILKLFCMSIFCPLYFDPIISNKCDMGNSVSTLWSGKSLNNVHMEHLKAKSEQVEYACKKVSEFLAMTQDEDAEEYQMVF
ncbi:hypothetical protein [Legionella cincinnatiensis]|uniref:Uncharacterized protein n=1 Tax=Legionella cincinnatiensis TaxID=28085 RepID=A0A378IPI8_9GAMM|nr:hypothetical protein [Legionella cincinnatiensis]KTC85246.1 hypothetical protein Lcin_1746 [Legionella cincinnatiensis]STX36391.1 Uncharacterised protein [Legionella cincinnatiensis]